MTIGRAWSSACSQPGFFDGRLRFRLLAERRGVAGNRTTPTRRSPRSRPAARPIHLPTRRSPTRAATGTTTSRRTSTRCRPTSRCRRSRARSTSAFNYDYTKADTSWRYGVPPDSHADGARPVAECEQLVGPGAPGRQLLVAAEPVVRRDVPLRPVQGQRLGTRQPDSRPARLLELVPAHAVRLGPVHGPHRRLKATYLW